MYDSAIENYYASVLEKSSDLRTNACCTNEHIPKYIKECLKIVHPQVLSKYYGCGLCVPEDLADCDVLDLGCGAGRDCVIIAQLVGKLSIDFIKLSMFG